MLPLRSAQLLGIQSSVACSLSGSAGEARACYLRVAHGVILRRARVLPACCLRTACVLPACARRVARGVWHAVSFCTRRVARQRPSPLPLLQCVFTDSPDIDLAEEVRRVERDVTANRRCGHTSLVVADDVLTMMVTGALPLTALLLDGRSKWCMVMLLVQQIPSNGRFGPIVRANVRRFIAFSSLLGQAAKVKEWFASLARCPCAVCPHAAC